MKLNSKIYREAAEVAWKYGLTKDTYKQYHGYCCNAILDTTDLLKVPQDITGYKHYEQFKTFFKPKREEISADAWKFISVWGYWGKCSKETTECRVLALLLLAEMAETEE